MSLISKEHLNIALKSIKKLLGQKADKSDIVQSDWSQNDETQSDYVKNRPFYEEKTEIPILENAELTLIFAEMGDVIYSYGDPVTFVIGHEYHLILDNEWERFEAFAYPANETEIYFRGKDSNNHDMFIEFSSGEVNMHGTFFDTLSLYEVTEGVKKLDEKYIPNSIARISELEYLKNGTTPIFKGYSSTYFSITSKQATVGVGDNGLEFSLKPGVIVIISFNYESPKQRGKITLNVNSTGEKQIVLGSSNNYNIPANFWEARDEIGFYYNGTNWVMLFKTPKALPLSTSISSTSTYTAATSSAVKQAYDLANNALSIYGGTMKGALTLKEDPVLNKHAATKQYVDNAITGIDIPEQKQSDWSQNDENAIDFIKNRTHYDSREVLLADGDFTFNNNDRYPNKYFLSWRNPSYIIETNIEYEVIFDGIIYKCIGCEHRQAGAYIGNGSMGLMYSSNDYENTGEPFCIWYENYYDGEMLYIYTTTSGNHKITIIKNNGELKQLDDKFIPDSIARVADIPKIEKVSQLENDAGYLTEHQSLDSYAKIADLGDLAIKDSLTAKDVGALPDTTEIPTVPTNISAFTNDVGYLTKHQDISGKLDADKLPQAVEDALTQAKASGEFDGKDGVIALTGASVGQIAQIIEVDENGVPTKWEAVDRTHYEDGETVKQLDEKFIPDNIRRNFVLHVVVNPETFELTATETFEEAQAAYNAGFNIEMLITISGEHPISRRYSMNYYDDSEFSFGVMDATGSEFLIEDIRFRSNGEILVFDRSIRAYDGSKIGLVPTGGAPASVLCGDGIWVDISTLVDARLRELGLIE